MSDTMSGLAMYADSLVAAPDRFEELKNMTRSLWEGHDHLTKAVELIEEKLAQTEGQITNLELSQQLKRLQAIAWELLDANDDDSRRAGQALAWAVGRRSFASPP